MLHSEELLIHNNACKNKFSVTSLYTKIQHGLYKVRWNVYEHRKSLSEVGQKNIRRWQSSKNTRRNQNPYPHALSTRISYWCRNIRLGILWFLKRSVQHILPLANCKYFRVINCLSSKLWFCFHCNATPMLVKIM